MDDIALLDEQQQEKAAAAQIADAKTREQEALAELEKALAEARLRGRNEVLPATDTDSTASAQPRRQTIEVKGKIEEESRSVKSAVRERTAQRSGTQGKDGFGLLQYACGQCP